MPHQASATLTQFCFLLRYATPTTNDLFSQRDYVFRLTGDVMNQHRHARAMVIVREAHFGSVLAMWSLHLLTHNFLCQALESFTWEIPGAGQGSLSRVLREPEI